jgi:hypothetical protein
MKYINTIFNQILQLLPENTFRKSVKIHGADRYAKTLTTFQLLKIHLFAHITGKISLRDISSSLSALKNKLHRVGLCEIAKSTLAYANEHRSYKVFEALFYDLLDKFHKNARSNKFKFKNPIYAMDSTIINLCLSVFNWAQYQGKKGAMKLHCMLDLRSDLPVFNVITEGKRPDITLAKKSKLPLSSDSIFVFDKGYLCYGWYKQLDDKGVTFVTRIRCNAVYRVLGQHSVSVSKRIISDEVIEFTGIKAGKAYPDKLRLVTVYDDKTDKTYQFLTNNFKFAATTIADIYKSRWQIETFFRWIKQNLKIKTFFGRSKNAVMLQIWAAMIYYLLLSWLKFQTKIAWEILELSRRIKSTLFENLSLLDLLACNFENKDEPQQRAVQLTLF